MAFIQGIGDTDQAFGYAIAAAASEYVIQIVTRSYDKADVSPLPILGSLVFHCAIAYVLINS